MAFTAGEVRVILSAQHENLVKGFGQARDEVDRFGRGAEAAAKQVNLMSVAAKAMTIAIAALGLRAAAQQASAFVAEGMKMAQISDATAASTRVATQAFADLEQQWKTAQVFAATQLAPGLAEVAVSLKDMLGPTETWRYALGELNEALKYTATLLRDVGKVGSTVGVALKATWYGLQTTVRGVATGIAGALNTIAYAGDKTLHGLGDLANGTFSSDVGRVLNHLGDAFEGAKDQAADLTQVLHELTQNAGDEVKQSLGELAGDIPPVIAKAGADTVAAANAAALAVQSELNKDIVAAQKAADDALIAAGERGLAQWQNLQHEWRMLKLMASRAVWEHQAESDAAKKAAFRTPEQMQAEAAIERERMQKQAEDERNAVLAQRVTVLTAYGEALGNLNTLTAEGAKGSAAAFRVHQATSIATAGINAWLAYTQALATPGVPVWLKQTMASTALGAGLAAVGQIASQKPPGRASGGPVSRGSMYEVGERGPELVNLGDRQFLATGNRSGSVQPIGPGGGNKVEVNVINAPGTTARVQEQQTPDGGSRIDVIVEQVSAAIAGQIAGGTGPMPRAMESQYGLNRSRGARR